jgi:hypothetical protein
VSLAHSPSIVLNGLVLAFDVANRKTFANSIINSTSWSLGSGSVTGYAQNGATAENERVTGTDPFGKSAVVWETRPQGNTADDGGWNSSWYNIDSTKLHRFSVWVKRTTDTSGGTFYLGLYGNNGIRRTDNNAVESNPYWDCRGTSGFEKDVWYLVVGHCYPYNTTYTGQHPESGIYTVAGGPTKVTSINACNIGADVKWAGVDVTQAIHRCYHYYCSDSTTRLQLFDPRIDVIDGTEPSISSLLSGFTANRLSSLTNNITGAFVNGPTYSTANGGSLVFDGVDDYVELNTNNIITGTNPFTFEAFYTITNTSVNAEIFGNYGTGYASNAIWISGRYGVYINTPVPYFQGYPLGAGTYHMAFTRTSTGDCILYKNGIVDGTATNTTSISVGQNFRIGSDVNGIGEVFGGNLYNLKVYNRALSAAEVSQNFNALRGRFGI